jgi:hypothetical protein
MRDQEVLSLRPTLNLPETESGIIESFQNKSLRPILKYQHDLLVLVFKNQMKIRKNAFFKLPSLQKEAYIEQTIRADSNFKNRLVGLVIGHFTSEEFSIFSENETELSRRLTDLLVQRLQSAIKDL